MSIDVWVAYASGFISALDYEMLWGRFVESLTFDQLAIACTGVVAIVLANDDRLLVRRWAPIFGCLGQPFWFYSSWKAQQYGVLLLGLIYAFAWLRGFYNYWIKPRRNLR